MIKYEKDFFFLYLSWEFDVSSRLDLGHLSQESQIYSTFQSASTWCKFFLQLKAKITEYIKKDNLSYLIPLCKTGALAVSMTDHTHPITGILRFQDETTHKFCASQYFNVRHGFYRDFDHVSRDLHVGLCIFPNFY